MLTKMLRFAYERGKLLRLPVIHKLKEPAPRQGFFEPEQFNAVRRRLSEDLQVAVSIAYTYGWRMQSEVLTLELTQVNLEAGTLELYPGTTKNDEGRLVYLTPELKALLTAQVRRVKQLARGLNRVIPYLFPHLDGHHKGEKSVTSRSVGRARAGSRACRECCGTTFGERASGTSSMPGSQSAWQ